MLDPEPGLLDRGVDPRIGQTERHRRVVKRDRRRPRGYTCLHALPRCTLLRRMD
jgi:hypothetical protein